MRRQIPLLIGLVLAGLLFTGATVVQVQAQTATVQGTVTDDETGEPLTGATVILEGTSYNAVVRLDGSFTIRSVPHGTYTLEASFVSFRPLRREITVTDEIPRLSLRLSPDTAELDGVVVSARRDLRTEQSARVAERQAEAIINVMDARSIELSPDVTVANVVQRVSGVSLERSSTGDGQHAIVRGMDKRYNYTLVNGIKIPSPDLKNRYVPLDIFPSDLLDRLVVSKSLTPDMEGDAIGGVIDMKMRDAPERLTASVDVGLGFSQLFAQRDFLDFDSGVVATQSPRAANGPDYRAGLEDFPFQNLNFNGQGLPLNQRAGFAIGNRFWEGRLGVLAAGSYQQSHRGSNSLFFEMDTDRENNNPFFDTVQQRQFSAQQTRTGLHAKLDYRASRNHTFDWYNALIRLDDSISRARVDTNLRIGRGQGPGTGRITERYRSQQQLQNIFNSTLQGEHTLLGEQLNVDWSAVYSRATQDDPDLAEFRVLTGTRRNGTGDIVQERALVDRDLDRRWAANTDQDLAGYLNATWATRFASLPMELSAGGMYRFKDRDNTFNSYLLRLSPNTQEWDGDIMSTTWTVVTRTGTPTDPLNYTSEERLAAYYGMAKLFVGDLQVLGGLRVEHTDFSWRTNAPETIPGRVGSNQYVDYLPSLHFRYALRPDLNMRLSYFRSLSRPNFFEVVPFRIIEEEFQERGNPFLERTRAHNLDLRAEFFPGPLNKFMGALFFKQIDDPIESALAIDGQRIFLQSNNFGTAYNFGLELDLSTYYRNFGLRGFYTFTNSEITTSKIVRFRDENGTLTSRQQEQTRPLQGQSQHIGNVSLLYKNQDWGTDAQLAGVYTGRRILSVSPYFENDIWQRAFWQLDLSVEQRLLDGVVVYAKINNLLNTPLRADVLRPNTANPQEAPYLDTSASTLVREDFYQRTYLFGVKYDL